MTRSRVFKLFGLILLISLTTLTAGLTAYKIGEKYFFDKLFYKRSPLHGYLSNAWMFSKNYLTADPISKSRMKNLYQLLAFHDSTDQSKILGANTDNIYKIAIIGDSYAYGTGVKTNQRFPDILENMLNKIRPTKVYNLSQMDDDLLDHYAKFKLAQSWQNFDLYVFTMVQNDFQIFLDRLNRYPNKSQLYQELKEFCPQPHYNPLPYSPEIDYETDVWINDVMSSLEGFDNICLLKQFVKEASTFPIIFYDLEDYLSLEQINTDAPNLVKYIALVMDKYNNTVKENNGYLLKAFDSKSNNHFSPVSQIESHPSAKTHQWYAAKLFQEITANPRYGFN